MPYPIYIMIVARHLRALNMVPEKMVKVCEFPCLIEGVVSIWNCIKKTTAGLYDSVMPFKCSDEIFAMLQEMICYYVVIRIVIHSIQRFTGANKIRVNDCVSIRYQFWILA